MLSLWARGAAQAFTIANGADGSLVDPVNLGGNFKTIVITCEDASNIPATTGLTALVGYEQADTLADLYEANDPTTKWSKANLPTTGTLAFVLRHAEGARRIRLVMSNNATGGSVVFKVRGFDKGS